jgi:2-oxoisovalerate dehydrogenase E1 component alpha subunit
MTTTVASFEVPYLQILTETSEICTTLPEFAKDAKTLNELYRVMVLTRLFDKKAIALQRTGKMGTYAPINGQEAISTAIGHALRKDDVFIPYYRDYAAQFQRGVKISDILSYWGGDERGNFYDGKSKDLPICVPIASQCLHAAGVGFSFKYRNENKVALVCIGDGGTSEGDFYEAINVSGAWQLPVVFIINNNQWAISVPIEKQTASQTLAQKAIAAGIDCTQVDGNDILALRKVIGDAIEKARHEKRPTLIEALTFRLSDHTTADDATRYQDKHKVALAEQKDPIPRFKKYLEKAINFSEADENALYEECHNIIQQEVDNYLSKASQPIESIFDYHFAELPEYLIEQRAIAMEASAND